MEIFGISLVTLTFLFFTAILASFIDTLAGGGGLITVPALIASGVPPLSTLATNKFQSSMGTATATYVMLVKTKRVLFRNVKFLMLSAFIGSTLGTIAVQFINTKVLDFAIPAILLLITIYFITAPKIKNETRKPKISNKAFQRYVVPPIGWYDGMFGPGTGSFFALAGVSLRGQNLIDSTAVAKTLNFSTNIAALFVFLLAGKVVWVIGVTMMLGQFIGAWCGSHTLLKINPQILRVLVVIVCLSMLVKYSISKGWITF